MSEHENQHGKPHPDGRTSKPAARRDGHDAGNGLDWLALHFPNDKLIASPGIATVPAGPYGKARLAGSREISRLLKRAEKAPDHFIRLLDAYAVAHDPNPTVIQCDPFPLPLGEVSPNCLVLGRSGAGKTQKGTLPAAADAVAKGYSLVYLNVKGNKQTRFIHELAIANRRGTDVMVLAPRKPDRTLGFTALEGCEDIAEASEVAACIVASAARNSRSDGGAWAYNQAQEFITHAISAICTDLPPARRTLLELRRVVIAGTYRAFAEAHSHFPVLSKFARYVDAGNQNAATIAATIGEATAFIDNTAACLSAHELSLVQFAAKGGVLVLEIDEHDMDRLQTFCAITIGRLLSALQREASTSPTGALPHKTVIVIDELAAAGPIPGLSTALHTCRERGFGVFAGVQSRSQLSAIYGSHADVIDAGFQTQIALGGGLDVVTAEHLSQKSGMTTVPVPSIIEQIQDEGTTVTNRNWAMVGRHLLLPGDIANPPAHPQLGVPATVFLGDGTPPFQLYLKAAFEDGRFATIFEAIHEMQVDSNRREIPLEASICDAPVHSEHVSSPGVAPFTFTDTSGWAPQQINAKIDETLTKLDWDSATSRARQWWSAFRDANPGKPDQVLRLAEELLKRKASINELYLAYVYSNTDSIQANLYFLDYKRLKDEEWRRKEAERKKSAPDIQRQTQRDAESS